MTTPASRPGLRDAQGRLFFAWLFTLPILLVLAAERAFGAPWPGPLLMDLGMLVMAFPVLFVVGGPTLSRGLRRLVAGRPGVEGAVTGAILLAYCSGVVAVLTTVPGYAGLSAVAMSCYLTGRYAADRARMS